jgi:hypothetical protein
MNTSKLQEFVTKIAAKKRITFGDVRRLQRDVLPDGIMSRADAEHVLRLDGEVDRKDGAWTDWLVAAIVDFVVWGERPTGAVEGEAAQWLIGLLTEAGAPTRAGRRIVREIRCEADRIAEPMVTFEAGDDVPVPAMALPERSEPAPAGLPAAA